MVSGDLRLCSTWGVLKKMLKFWFKMLLMVSHTCVYGNMVVRHCLSRTVGIPNHHSQTHRRLVTPGWCTTRDLWWTYPGESSNGTPRNEHCWKITQLYSLMIAPAINSIEFGHFPARKDNFSTYEFQTCRVGGHLWAADVCGTNRCIRWQCTMYMPMFMQIYAGMRMYAYVCKYTTVS